MSTSGQDERANPARVYDYLLGGNTNHPADQRAAKKLMAAKPHLKPNVLAARQFLIRAVRHLAAEEHLTQFLDIGAGIPGDAPGMDNTHEVAQAANPAARVVLVDNDPVVLAHAKALLTSTPEGTVAYVQADLHQPADILGQAARTLDFSEPIAVMILGVLYLIEDAEDPWGIVQQLMDAVPPGSFLAVLHPASDVHAEESARGARSYAQSIGIPQTNRTRREVARFFDGLDILPPGVVQANLWRPGPEDDTATVLSNWVGVGRKPAAPPL